MSAFQLWLCILGLLGAFQAEMRCIIFWHSVVLELRFCMFGLFGVLEAEMRREARGNSRAHVFLFRKSLRAVLHQDLGRMVCKR